jgi:hypothetical protein
MIACMYGKQSSKKCIILSGKGITLSTTSAGFTTKEKKKMTHIGFGI